MNSKLGRNLANYAPIALARYPAHPPTRTTVQGPTQETGGTSLSDLKTTRRGFFCPPHPIPIQACHLAHPLTDAQMAILIMAMSLVVTVDLHQGARIAALKALPLVIAIKEQPIHEPAMDSNLIVGIVATQKMTNLEILGVASAS